MPRLVFSPPAAGNPLPATSWAVAIFLLYFFGLGAVGLVGPDEPRYAQVAREMLHSGDYVTPHLNGQPWFEKPPLYYWLAALSFRLFGVTEWAARLPAAAAGAAFLLLFGWCARRLFPGETSLYALLVLASSVGWLGFSRAASPEILFTAPLAGALLLLALWVWHGRDTPLYGFYALLAVAALAKGPTAIVLSAMVLGVYCVTVGEYRWLLRVLAPGPLLLFVVAVAPWYGAVYWRNGFPFIEDFILKHHFARFSTAELAHPGPWWYYLPVVCGVVFPWTAHLGLVAADIAGLGWRGLMKDHRRIFLLAWVAPIVLFFSVSQAKLPGYVLVTAPALALWIGNQLARAPASRLRWVFAAQAILLPAAAIFAGTLPMALAEGMRAARDAWIGGVFGPDLWLAGVIIGGALLLLWTAWRGRRLAATALAAALTAVALARIIIVVAPATDRLASARPLAREIRARQIHPSHLALSPEVRRHIHYGLEFYLDHPLRRDARAAEAASWVVMGDGRIVQSPRRGEAQVESRD